MSTKPAAAAATRPTKKPVPAPVKPQKAPIKKPVPAAIKPQNKKTPTTVKTTPPAPTAKASPGQTQQQQGEKAENWISRSVQSQVARVGDYAGGWVNSIGDRVNKVGEGVGNSVTNTTRYWGQGVSGYGNDIKDAVGVGGPRVPTAGNPLGMAGMGAGKGAPPGGKTETGTMNAGKGSASNPLGMS